MPVTMIDPDIFKIPTYTTTSSPSVTIGNYTTDNVTINGYTTDNVTITSGTATVPLQSWTVSSGSPIKIKYEDICKLYNLEPEPEPKKEEVKKRKPMRRENPYTKKIEEHFERQKKTGIIYFTYIKEYVPNKVYEFTFNTNKNYIKTICDESDIFDLEKAFYIALAKSFNQPTLTPEGYVKKAEELIYDKRYIKIVQNGIKLFNLLKQEEEFEREEDERIKKKHEKYVQKKKNRALKKKNNANQDLYDTIKKAIEDAK